MKISTPAMVAATFLTGLAVGALGFATGGGWTLDGALMATRLAPLVEPLSELHFTARLDPSKGTLMNDGAIWDAANAAEPIGAFEASPKPLMGSN